MKIRNHLSVAVLLLTPLAGLAQVHVEKANYSLSFSSFWSDSFIPIADSTTVALMDTTHEAFAWTHGISGVGGLSAETYMQILTLAYTNDLTRMDSSTKTLGGRAFRTTGWAGVDTSGGDSTSRLRVYSFSQGNFLFISWLIYNAPEGDPAVADFESALATLNINAAAGIRRPSLSVVSSAGRPRLDALGRTMAVSPLRAPPTPHFLSR